MWHHLDRYFDKLEDRIRFRLSRYPVLYALIGAIGIVLVWKGVWEMAEAFSSLDGFMSFLLGTIILLMSGLLVSFFIGDSILMSGFRKEKKLIERAESEIRTERDALEDISRRLGRIEELLISDRAKEKNIE